MTSELELIASTFSFAGPGGTSAQIGVSGDHGCGASKVCCTPEESMSVKRYLIAPSTALKSNAGTKMNCLACSFQNGDSSGTPGRIGVSDSSTASRCNCCGVAGARPWQPM